MSMSGNDPADDLALALADALRAALEALPRSESSTDTLAQDLARPLAIRLSAAAVAAGATVPDLARALADRTAAAPARGSSLEERVLDALRRHTAGRTPGVTPESLASLTGLSAAVLAPAVSALIQAGEIVRDAWLVRLPSTEDLLPGDRDAEGRSASRKLAERRAIGDRRSTGERRLYDRRLPPGS